MIPWEIQNVIFEQYYSYVRMNKMNCNRDRVIVKLPSHLKNVAALPCVIQNSYTRPKKLYCFRPNVDGSNGVDCVLWQLERQEGYVTKSFRSDHHLHLTEPRRGYDAEIF